MANKFPHVEVIGIDLAPVIVSGHAIPDNCRFELDDINRGLPRFYGQIDLIHMRGISLGVSPRRRVPIRRDNSVQYSLVLFITSPRIQSDLKHLLSSDSQLP